MTPETTRTRTALADRDRRHFDVLAAIARAEAGLMIPPEKAPMVFARISKRLRLLGIDDLEAYCSLVRDPDGGEERRELICALTTNVTGFFREAHHFDFLRERLVPGIATRARAGKRIRIWSAGCSSGPEPYGIAMVLLDQIPDAGDLDIRILATDIDRQVLQAARRGVYRAEDLAPLPDGYLNRFLHRTETQDRFRIRPQVQHLVSFRDLNLQASWPMQGAFDAIFCRNVVIYFDQDTQAALWPRFARVCKAGGHLFLGHSERLPRAVHAAFLPVATTTFRRTSAAAPTTPACKD